MFNKKVFYKFASYYDGVFSIDKRESDIFLANRNIGYIYAIQIGEDVYVGKTENILSRANIHKHSFLTGKNLTLLQNAFDKTKRFDIYILMKVDMKNCSFSFMEQYFISLLEPSLNTNCAFMPNDYSEYVFCCDSIKNHTQNSVLSIINSRKKLSERIREICRFLKISQMTVSSKIGMETRTFRMHLTKQDFCVQTVDKIASVFGITSSALLNGLMFNGTQWVEYKK